MNSGARCPPAVVIGGGIAGLATAALLQRDGYQVTLLEARDRLGGRARTWQADGFRFDMGPSWYLMPEVFDHFFRLLGTSTTEQLTLHRLDPGYRVFFESDPGPVDVISDRAAAIALFERIEQGAGGRLARYLDSAGDAYRLALDSFLYSTFASLRPLLSADLWGRLPRLARLLFQPLETFVGGQFTDRRLRQILGYPAVFLGSAPSVTPSLYHLMSHLDLEDGVRYPAGGFGALIDAVADLGRERGVQIHTGAEVVSIDTVAQPVTPRRRWTGRAPGRARVAGVTARHADGSVRQHPAAVVVSAADLHHTETALLPPHLQTYPDRWWARRMSGPGAVLAYLGVHGHLPELTHHNLVFTAEWDRNFREIFGGSVGEGASVPRPASFYVCRPSATDPTVAPVGHENLFLLVPVPADVSLGSGGDGGRGDPAVERVADGAIAQLAAWARIPDLGERIVTRRTLGPADFERDLHAWKGGALGPAHTLRQSAFLRGRNASRRVRGLLYAGGSTIPGIGLPMCLISAELVLKRLHSDSGTGPLPEPAPSA